MFRRATLALLSAVCCLIVGATIAGSASAQTPEPSITPVAHPAIILHVINDLNGDGARQTSEPGLGGWTAYEGCSDALAVLGPTDATGEYRTPYPAADVAAFDRCFRLERKFGWLPTSPLSVTRRGQPGGTVDVTFLLRDLGRDAMEVTGEVIVRGLPAASASLSAGAPFEACAGAFVEPADWRTTGTIIVSAGRRHAGCPSSAQLVSVVLNGTPVATVPFASAQTETHDFVVEGDSMRLFSVSANGAQINGRDCAVVVSSGFTGLVPEHLVRIFVLSDEARPGCGTTSAPVRFLNAGQPLDPLVPWQAGSVDQFIDFVPASLATPTPALRVIAPDTGTGPAPDGRSGLMRFAVALAVIGATTAFVAIGMRRRFSR